MNVLMIMADFAIGGAETAALALVRSAQGRGAAFTVASIHRRGDQAHRFAQAGAKVVEGIAATRWDALAVLRVAGLVRRNAIDAVIVVDALRNGLVFGLLVRR